jgi:hypothetical protein
MEIYIYIGITLVTLVVVYMAVAFTLAKIFFNSAEMFSDLDWSDED